MSVTSPSEPVSIGVRASWLGFVGRFVPAVLSHVRFGVGVSSRPFTCVGCLVWFMYRFHLDTDSNMAVFVLGHAMELCREVGGTHLWVLAVASLLVAVQFIACCDGVWIDTSHLHIVRTTTTTTTTNNNPHPPWLTLLTRRWGFRSQPCHSLMRVAWHMVGDSTLWAVLSGRFGETGGQPGDGRGSAS